MLAPMPESSLGWATTRRHTPGVAVADNATARLDLDNEPQPDAMLYIAPERGGQVRIGPDDYVEAAPELVVEVASSSVSFDLNTKLHVYRRSGVQEYIVWRVLDSRIDWFVLRGGVYERLAADDHGVVRSERFPGLWLNTEALLRGDLAATLRTLDEGLATAEHAAFVTGLAGRVGSWPAVTHAFPELTSHNRDYTAVNELGRILG